MSIEGIIGIIIGVIGILLTIIIALRQGFFHKTKLTIIPGYNGMDNKTRKELRKRGLWAMICGYPKNNSDVIVNLLPYSIKNTGSYPLENVLIQFTFPSYLLKREIWDEEIKILKNEELYNYGCEMFVKYIEENCIVELTIPLIPKNHSIEIFLPQALENKKEIPTAKIHIFSTSKNLNKPQKINHWLVFQKAKNLSELIKLSHDEIFATHLKECPNHFKDVKSKFYFAPYPWWIYYKWIYPNCAMKKRFFYQFAGKFGKPDKPISGKRRISFLYPFSTVARFSGFDYNGLPLAGIKIEK